jgi:hypothetical protein
MARRSPARQEGRVAVTYEIFHVVDSSRQAEVKRGELAGFYVTRRENVMQLSWEERIEQITHLRNSLSVGPLRNSVLGAMLPPSL